MFSRWHACYVAEVKLTGNDVWFSGNQAKTIFTMEAKLPPNILGQIWCAWLFTHVYSCCYPYKATLTMCLYHQDAL